MSDHIDLVVERSVSALINVNEHLQNELRRYINLKLRLATVKHTRKICDDIEVFKGLEARLLGYPDIDAILKQFEDSKPLVFEPKTGFKKG